MDYAMMKQWLTVVLEQVNLKFYDDVSVTNSPIKP